MITVEMKKMTLARTARIDHCNDPLNVHTFIKIPFYNYDMN